MVGVAPFCFLKHEKEVLLQNVFFNKRQRTSNN